jgi:hypothetical protein
MSFSHNDEDIDYTLKVYKEVLPMLKEAVDNGKVREAIKGKPVQPVFRKTSDFNTKPVKK